MHHMRCWYIAGAFIAVPSQVCSIASCGRALKGCTLKSDGSLAVADIDASKGFVGRWEHLALAVLANFDVKKQLKRLSTKI